MKPLIIVGARGFGSEIYQLVCDINNVKPEWEILGFLDDDVDLQGEYIFELQVLGGIEYLERLPNVSVVLAISDSKAKGKIIERILNISKSIHFPNILHPTISTNKKYINFGIGNVVCQYCLFTTNVEIGDFNTFNTRVTLGHDIKVGNFNSFNPNVQISGNVLIGSFNFFAVNSVILQGISIGDFNFIGACSLVIKKIKDNTKVFGIPAQKFMF